MEHSATYPGATFAWNNCFFFLNTYAVKLEKAEILEKTISYIKKLQDLTGDKCVRMGSETEISHSDGEKIPDL